MDDIRSADQFRAAMAGEASIKFLFFWGHQPSPNGSVTKSCFSQWWVAPFTIDGTTYPTAEHYMMACKARLSGDEAALGRILAAKYPKQAKQWGRSVDGFNDATWTEHRFRFVVTGNYAKFSQNPNLGQFLLGTGTRVLVEASPVDRIWGIGLTGDDERASDPARWPRLNLLDFAMMEARARLRNPAR